MNTTLDSVQSYGKDSVDAAVKSFGLLTKSVQTITLETADYSKKSLEQGTAAIEKILGAKSLDKAMELQSEYLKSTYESLIAQSNRMSELYVDLAKQFYKPLEGFAGKLPTGPFTGQASS
jgi:hypothetical protein